MSRDIDDRIQKRDPVIVHLEASRDIAHAERDKAIALAAELTAELQRARRSVGILRLTLDLERADRRAEVEAANDRHKTHCEARASLGRQRAALLEENRALRIECGKATYADKTHGWFKAHCEARDAASTGYAS